MNDHSILTEIVAVLAASVVIVPITLRLRLGSVIGYLLAGVLIGPWVLSLVTDAERMSHVSEMGVVFLLFIIGLELDPKKLWSLRLPIFGMGFAQLTLVAGAIGLLGCVLQLSPLSSLVLGIGAALSSTAIVTQILKERGLLSTIGGSSAFSILLFQDIAVIPVLAVLPVLAGSTSTGSEHPMWKVLVVFLAVILVGQFLLRHVFRLVAAARLREVFTALSLLMVVGLASLMDYLGLSMALGAFLGGVLLATSEYRHAIESDIEPFKGLLLGAFFMSVGMNVNLPTIAAQPGKILLCLFVVVLVKFTAHAFLAKVFRLPLTERGFFSVVLSQVGEFAFVLFGAGLTLGLLSADEVAVFSVVTAFSMALTPLLIIAHDKLWAPRLLVDNRMADEVIENDNPEVVIAGFGRVGQIIGRILYASGVRATVLDHDPDQIEMLRKFGFKVYYGDATRLDLLEAAGLATAKILVVAVDDVTASLAIVDLAKQHFPHLKIIARARNVGHVFDLLDRGVTLAERETFETSLKLGRDVLQQLGWSPYQAVRSANKFRDHNLEMLADLHHVRTEERDLVSAAKQAREDLEKMFNNERSQRQTQDESWELHPDSRND